MNLDELIDLLDDVKNNIDSIKQRATKHEVSLPENHEIIDWAKDEDLLELLNSSYVIHIIHSALIRFGNFNPPSSNEWKIPIDIPRNIPCILYIETDGIEDYLVGSVDSNGTIYDYHGNDVEFKIQHIAKWMHLKKVE